METTVRTVDMTIDWDSIYVSVFPRISSRITPGDTYTQRKLDYNESHKTPKEINREALGKYIEEFIPNLVDGETKDEIIKYYKENF